MQVSCSLPALKGEVSAAKISMSGKFIPAAQAEREKLDWGTLAWLSRPTTTEAEQLVVI